MSRHPTAIALSVAVVAVVVVVLLIAAGIAALSRQPTPAQKAEHDLQVSIDQVDLSASITDGSPAAQLDNTNRLLDDLRRFGYSSAHRRAEIDTALEFVVGFCGECTTVLEDARPS